MPQARWLRIIPVAFVMYTISYIDRTNISLALAPMSHSLGLDAKVAGLATGIFFFGYVMLQIPGGHLAHRWSAKRLIGIFLVLWGVCAIGNGLVRNAREFLIMRFCLGVSESAVFPATLVLLAHWFPRRERARANALWMLCQPLAVALSAPLSGWILDAWTGAHLDRATGLENWRAMLILEGALPFLWLPIWLAFVSDHPREAKWISKEELEHLEITLRREARELQPAQAEPVWGVFVRPQVILMLTIYFLLNTGAYGCMFWLPSALKSIKELRLSNTVIGLLFAAPYLLTGVTMLLHARHSDLTHERPWHVAAALGWSGLFLMAAVFLWNQPQPPIWLCYACICVAVTGPFTALAPFWAIATETLAPGVVGSAMGLINAMGNLGGFAGPFLVGYLEKQTHNFIYGFGALSVGLLAGAVIVTQLKRVSALGLNPSVAAPAEQAPGP